MPYNPNDVAGFPPPSGYKQMDFQSLCDMADPAKVFPIGYAFGGAAPDAIELRDGTQLKTSGVVNASRVFIELSPYYWGPES